MALFRCGAAGAAIDLTGSTNNFFTYSAKRGQYRNGVVGNGSTVAAFDGTLPTVNYGALAQSGSVVTFTYSVAGTYLEFFSDGSTDLHVVQREIGDTFIVAKDVADATLAISVKIS